MSGKTAIAWSDMVWNPTSGCTRVSPGCDSCYAFALHDRRYRANAISAGWHERMKPEEARAAGFVLPMPPQYDLPFSRVQLLPERLTAPLHWRKPRRVFVDSMADLFHEDVPDAFLDQVFAVMALCPQHTFQVLTKRPERMRDYLLDMEAHYVAKVDGEYMERWGDAAAALTGDPCSAGAPVEDCGWPLPNVWLGVSVEDQQRADERVPILLETPAAVRFLSVEPMLGPVDVKLSVTYARRGLGSHLPWPDWVICGGESGVKARPFDIAWARSLRDQCLAAAVAFFYKQGGASNRCPHSPHGGHLDCFPEDLKIREFPGVGSA